MNTARRRNDTAIMHDVRLLDTTQDTLLGVPRMVQERKELDALSRIELDLMQMSRMPSEPRVYIIPLGQRGDGYFEASKLEWNIDRRMVSFRRMSGVDLSAYHPVANWRYGGKVYQLRRR